MKPLDLTANQRNALQRYVKVSIFVPIIVFPLLSFALSYILLSADFLSDLPAIPLSDRLVFAAGGLLCGLAVALVNFWKLWAWWLLQTTFQPPKPEPPPTEATRPSTVNA